MNQTKQSRETSEFEFQKNDTGEKILFPASGKFFSEKKSLKLAATEFIIIIFAVCAVVDVLAVSLYRNESTKLMNTISRHIITDLCEEVAESDDFSVINLIMAGNIEGYAETQNMQFFICNSRGYCILNTSNYEEITETIFLSESQRKKIRNSDTFSPSIAGISISSLSLYRADCFEVECRSVKEEYYLLTIYPDPNFKSFSINIAVVSAFVFLAAAAAAAAALYIHYRKFAEYFSGYSGVIQKFARDDFSSMLAVPPYEKPDYFTQMIEATNQIALNIETNEERKKQFISNVSHELRTPMTSICGFVDGILDGTIPPQQERKYLTIVSQETRRLKNMIQSMLNLTKIESGTLSLPKLEINITDIVVRTLLLFENQINEKKIEIECNTETPFKVNANKDYIQQVVYNLTENAVKFVNEGGKITVSVCKDEELPEMVDIVIRNTGEGLSSEELPRIFDRFYKTDQSRSRDKTGLGLGLTICRRIVYLHGGHIIVKSAKGEYTEFTVQLPGGKA